MVQIDTQICTKAKTDKFLHAEIEPIKQERKSYQ